MRNKKRLLIVLLILLLVGGLIGVYYCVFVREDAAQYLENRLARHGITAVDIHILTRSPLHLEITFESESTGKDLLLDDHLTFLIIQREATLARQNGYPIDWLTYIVKNVNGERIVRTEVPIYSNTIAFQVTPARQADGITGDMIAQALNAQGIPFLDAEHPAEGLSIAEIRVTSLEGVQTLFLDLYVPRTATSDYYSALSDFPDILENLINTQVNPLGSQILLSVIRVSDEKGGLIYYQVSDYQLHIGTDWFDYELYFREPHQGMPVEMLMTLFPENFLTETPTSTP